MKKKIIINGLLSLVVLVMLIIAIVYMKRTGKDIYYEVGILSGMLFAIVGITIMQLLQKQKPLYDERQLQARGVCYKYAWGVLVACLVIDGGIREIFGLNWANFFTGIILWILVSSVVFVVLAIFLDAYETNATVKSRVYVIFILLGIFNIAFAIYYCFKGEMIENRALTGYAINLFAGIAILIMGSLALIKRAIDGKEDDNYEEPKA